VTTAEKIACALGAASGSGAWWRCVCPVHGSRTGRSTTLALRDGDRSRVAHCHAGCDARDILDELRRRGLLGDAGKYLVASRGQGRDDDPLSRHRRIEFAGRIWAAAGEAPGSPVARYLAGRGVPTLAAFLALGAIPAAPGQRQLRPGHGRAG
jgi:hypothetical protein